MMVRFRRWLFCCDGFVCAVGNMVRNLADPQAGGLRKQLEEDEAGKVMKIVFVVCSRLITVQC